MTTHITCPLVRFLPMDNKKCWKFNIHKLNLVTGLSIHFCLLPPSSQALLSSLKSYGRIKVCGMNPNSCNGNDSDNQIWSIISWRKHFTLSQIYGDLQPLSVTLAKRRGQFAGHAFRAKGEIIVDILLRKASTGRKLAFPDTISRDTGIKSSEPSCSHGK